MIKPSKNSYALLFVAVVIFSACHRSRSSLPSMSEAKLPLMFPEVCPSTEKLPDAEWCASQNRLGRECNYKRPDGSIVFKLLDNVWYNCPQHCFGCKFPGAELNITLSALASISEDFKLQAADGNAVISTDLIEFWLERQVIEEAFKGQCEDAAAYGEAGESDVCASWIAENPSYCNLPNFKNLNAMNPRQDFSKIKGNGFWWCRRSCKHCSIDNL